MLRSDTPFDVAVFDMVMPHMDGLELVRFMRQDPRLQHVPVGIMTAEQDPKLWNDSLSAGAGIFLPKPFTPEQLRYMLKVLMSQRSVISSQIGSVLFGRPPHVGVNTVWRG
jgi:two-component system chemotaxis response regulator CheY